MADVIEINQLANGGALQATDRLVIDREPFGPDDTVYILGSAVSSSSPTYTDLTVTNSVLISSIATPAAADLHLIKNGLINIVSDVYSDTFSSGLTFRRAHGTFAAPAAIESGDALMTIGGSGYGDTAFSTQRALFQMRASENWTDAAQGSRIEFYTTPNNSTTVGLAATIKDNGTLLIRNIATPTTIADTLILQAYDTDAASYTNMITLTAGDPATCDLNTDTTIGGANIYRVGSVIPVNNGGTGTSSIQIHHMIVGNDEFPVITVAPGANGTLWTSNGESADPSWIALQATVAQGGTGRTTLTANNVLLGNGTSSIDFVAPGTSGNVLQSDGTTWVSAAIETGSSVSYAGMLEPLAYTWTTRTPSADHDWLGLAWSPQLRLWCSVSGNGNVMTSPDGITWTARTAAEANFWNGVCWADAISLFVAVSENGTNRVMTSPDGITWTARSAAAANQWKSVAWSEDLALLVAVAASGSQRVMTSTDGITWAGVSVSFSQAWNNVIWAKEAGIFCAVSTTASGSNIMTSSNGTSWTQRSAPNSDTRRFVGWSPQLGLFCAPSAGNTVTSPDGITWTQRTSSEAGNWNYVTWSPQLNLFIIVGSSGTNRVMLSRDGITYFGKAATQAITWRCVVWSQELGMAVALATSGTNRVMTSKILVT